MNHDKAGPGKKSGPTLANNAAIKYRIKRSKRIPQLIGKLVSGFKLQTSNVELKKTWESFDRKLLAKMWKGLELQRLNWFQFSNSVIISIYPAHPPKYAIFGVVDVDS